jgi:benzoyl-CoA reductase subunit B
MGKRNAAVDMRAGRRTTGAAGVVGRGRREGNRLMKEFFAAQSAAAEEGRQAAYSFVMGSAAEVLRAFDLPVVYPEINSLQTAVHHEALDYLNRAEDYGYSTDVCGYVKADVGAHLDGGRLLGGRIPRPALVLATNTCLTYVKWVEIWERIYGCPVFVLDLPGERAASADGSVREPHPDDVAYVRGELEELVALCQQVTGRSFDPDRLRESMAETARMSEHWREALRLNRRRPAPFNAMGDAITFMGVGNAYRGTPEGVRYFRELSEEMQAKADAGLGSLPEERFRLHFSGAACYPAFRAFLDLFTSWGGVFVQSEYLSYASGGLHLDLPYDDADPLGSLARQMLLASQRSYTHLPFSHAQLAEECREWSCDGIVFHSTKSCRTTSASMADFREYLIRQRSIPSLLIESDLVDPRYWSEAQVKNRVDAFFEALESQRAASRGA